MSEVVSLRSRFPVPVEALWAWHERPGAFERLTPPWEKVQLLERRGGLGVGARTALLVRLGPLPTRWVSEHTACDPGALFRDEQKEGPFKRFVHEHRFAQDGAGASALEDHLTFELPLGGAGRALAAASVRRRLERLLRYRHAVLQADLARHEKYARAPRAGVAITGGSGMLGTALGHYLSTAGHDVRAVRRTPIGLDAGGLEGAHAVVHLAGAGIGDARWTDARKQALVDSRVAFTGTLLEELERLRNPPPVLVSASAVGFYGDRGDEELTEQSAPGTPGTRGPDFLASLCAQWETAARRAEPLGMRVVILRFGVVLSARGGALEKMLPAFKAGVGGPIAGGSGWMSWVSLEDVLGAVELSLFDRTMSGAYNVVAPPVTNADFTRALGRVLRRPVVTPLPAFALRALYGELAEGTLLSSQRVVPFALPKKGFHLLQPDLEPALRFTLGR